MLFFFSFTNKLKTKARTNCHRAGQNVQLFMLHKRADGGVVDITGMHAGRFLYQFHPGQAGISTTVQ